MTRLFAGTPWDQPPACEVCGGRVDDCGCDPDVLRRHRERAAKEQARRPPEKQSAKVFTEKRKGGRTVTIVAGLVEPDTDLSGLQSQLQSACGGGGSLDKAESRIVIQGDHRDAVADTLREIGYRVRSG